LRDRRRRRDLKSFTHPTGQDEAAFLDHLYKEMKDCQLCPLAESRTGVVFGAGRCNAEIMFVGEAPGYHEDVQGIPFVGSAGKLLSDLLESIGINREDVYITNVNKCRPPENRTPNTAEIEACKPYLQKQIDIIKPRILCSLGNNATQTILGKRVGISKVRGRSFQENDYFIFPMFHPAAALHLGSRMEDVREDFQKLREFVGSDQKPVKTPEQMELF
jgi:DNA polymerase